MHRRGPSSPQVLTQHEHLQGRQPFKVTLQTKGGHASMPVTDGTHAAARLARVLAAIDSRQPRLSLRSPVPEMLRGLAPGAPFMLRGLLAHSRVWCAAGSLVAMVGCACFSTLHAMRGMRPLALRLAMCTSTAACMHGSKQFCQL